MASKIKVDQIVGSTGNTVTFPAGQTVTITDGLTVAGGGTGLASFTAGDVLYATGSTTLAKLAKGTAEQVLAMNSGATAPDWGSVDLTVLPTITVAKGGTNIASFTAGDILYATGSTTLAKLAKGTTLQHLRMNAGATAPEWTAAPAGGKLLQMVSVTKDEEFTATGGVPSTITNGGQLFTYDFTPTAADSTILVMTSTVAISEESNGGNICWLSLWNGSTFISANSGSSLDSRFAGSILMAHTSICDTFAAGSTSARAIQVRGGMDSGTGYINGASSPNYNGSSARCSMVIQEIGA